MHDPMDCNHMPTIPGWDPAWGTQEEWNWGSTQEANTQSPTDIDYVNNNQKGAKGGGKSFGKSGSPQGGKSGNNQNPIQYHMMMLMKALGKGGGKSGGYQGQSNSQGKGVNQSGAKGGGCHNCGKSGRFARECPHPKIETRLCNNCGKKGHLAAQCRIPVREVTEEESQDVIWGSLMVDEIQDVDVAGKVMSDKEREEILAVIRKEKQQEKTSTLIKPNSNPTWRKKIQGGHRIKFVLDSGAVKTIIPKDAIPGMKLDKSKGGSFRVASGEVIPNLGSTKLTGKGTLNQSSIQINTQVAEITKPLASVDEMVTSGMMVIMHKTGGIAKRLDLETERKIRDLVKGGRGNEVILERAGGAFTFETDVKSEEAGGWKELKNAIRRGNTMDVDESVPVHNRFSTLREEQCDESECTLCDPIFQRH